MTPTSILKAGALKRLAAAGLLLAAVSPGLAQAAPPAAANPKAMAATAAAPPPAPAHEIHFPAFEQKTLANGLRVVVVQQHAQPIVSLRMVLNAGKAYEPEGKAGLAGATASLLSKGTASRSAQQIAESIDFVGGSLGANAGTESGYVNASVTSDQLDLGFDLLSDIVLHPAFPQEEIERWRKQALSGLQISEGDAGYLAGTAATRLVFGTFPYGRPSSGTSQSLAGLTRDDLVAFHQSHYIPVRTILAIVGDVQPADAFARAERAFGAWKAERPPVLPPFEVQPPPGTRIVVIDKPDAVQTEIRIGQVGIAYHDPSLYAAEVYNSVIGGNASSRLYDEIRRKRGLSYGAGSSFLYESQPGFFEISTFTKTASTADALGLAFDVVRGLQEKPVPEPELNAAKTYITGAFPLEIETADGIASKVIEAMHFGYGRDFLEGYNDQISKVTPVDVQKFAKDRIKTEWMIAVLAGNASAFVDELKKKYGEVEVIPATEVDFLQPDLRKVKPAVAAAPPSAAEQEQGMALLRQAQQALGGKAFVEQKTQVVKGTGTIHFPGMPQPMTVTSYVDSQLLPDKQRTEIDLTSGSMIQITDGAQAWMQMAAEVQDISSQLKDRRFYGYDVLRQAGQTGYTARPLPDAEVGGKPMKVVELADLQGHATRFFLDPATHLVAEVSFELNRQKPELFFSDYREISGVKVPFKLSSSQQGSPFLDLTVTDVQVNPAVDPSLFQKPKG
jgi:predicted Zn-dependent peptidase